MRELCTANTRLCTGNRHYRSTGELVHRGTMLTTTPHPRRQRRHGELHDRDRRALERAGWRTLLDYRENHVRDADGTLLHVEPQWTAEAERIEQRPGAAASTVVTTVTARSRVEAWSLLKRVALAR